MRRREILFLLLLIAGFGTAALAAPAETTETPFLSEDLGVCALEGAEGAPEALPVAKGGGKPPADACCDPDLEPGTNGNPFCFEGHSCCSDGVWRCNNPDATPSCDPGHVCNGSCGAKGESCATGAECCSGTCGKNGRCR